ncbi:hypothetical protein [Lentilactobacillus sunkii]|nr:hypothetical protein [Lentilactobacillus sunkii]
MNRNLKKSLFISMTALGFVAAVGAAKGQNVSAKSYASVTSNQKMTTDPTTRNVTLNGSNAIYNKAGTLRGARVLANTATAKTLANATVSTANFRAYRVATTNRGSVYYKVVSFDGNFRGWIYGGKSQASFGGGLADYNTFTSTTLSDTQKTSTYKITTPGTGDDSVTWISPQNTQYKVGKQVTDTTPYANATFTIDQIGYRTREGSSDVWVHILNTNNSQMGVNGWIKLSSLTAVQTPQADNAVRINFTDPNGKIVKTYDYTVANAVKGNTLGQYSQTSALWVLNDSTASSLIAGMNAALNNSGYKLGSADLTTAQKAALAAAKFGTGTVDISVVSTATNTAFSTITPYGSSTGTQAHALTGTTQGIVDAGANFPDADPNTSGFQPGYLTATTLNGFSSTQLNIILSALTNAYRDPQANGAQILSSINATFKQAAQNQYVVPSGLNFTNNNANTGTTFTADQLMGYIRSNPSLFTLQSPKYPVFTVPAGSYGGTNIQLSWETINYTATSTLNGTIGQPVNVYYNYSN